MEWLTELVERQRATMASYKDGGSYDPVAFHLGITARVLRSWVEPNESEQARTCVALEFVERCVLNHHGATRVEDLYPEQFVDDDW